MSRVWHVLMVPVLAVALVLAAPTHARAETKIAVVDFETLLEKSVAANAASEKLKAQGKDLQKDLIAKEKELRADAAALSKEKAKLKPEEFKAKAKEFEEELAKNRTELSKQKEALDRSMAVATSNLRKEVYKIVAEIADQEKYSLVLSSQNVVIAEKSMDITQKVLDKLNATVKEVPLKK